MPGQVKTKTKHPADAPRPKRGASAPDIHDNDMSNLNRNLQHSHALRLALGSILTPKRPYSPSSYPHSKSSSGTASPALSYSFSSPPSSTIPTPPSVSPTPPQAPHPTPRGMHRLPDQYLHNLQHAHPPTQLANMHQFSHVHTPSRLGLPEPSPSGDYLSKGDPALTAPSAHDRQRTAQTHAPDPGDPSICSPKPAQAMPAGVQQAPAGPDGSAQPRARFIETLQSERAWDALIHGSFS